MSYFTPDALDLIPRHMRAIVVAYVERGAWCDDDFFEAVLCNDLVKAFIYADDENKRALGNWARFLFQHMPSPAWKNRESIRAWIEQHGLEGYKKKAG